MRDSAQRLSFFLSPIIDATIMVLFVAGRFLALLLQLIRRQHRLQLKLLEWWVWGRRICVGS